jgi:hypothetical protein
MRSLLLAVLGLVLFRPATHPAPTWDGKGHMTVAEVAWATLGKDATGQAIQDKIKTILSKHPYPQDIGWQDSPGNEQLRDAFAAAATWPDLIKHDSHHPSAPYHPVYRDFAADFGRPVNEAESAFESALHAWHFYDVRIQAKPTGAGFVADTVPSPIPLAAFPARIDNAYQALAWTRGILSDTTADPKMRAIALCWIEHLVGDLHQPLHCATFVTAQNPKGDRGGNDFHLPTATSTQNLHAVWDDILDPHGKKQTIPTVTTHLLHQVDPTSAIAAPETGELDIDAAHWIQHGGDLAASSAYAFEGQGLRDALDNADDVHVLMKQYRTDAEKLAEQRALLGGLRLAEILKKDLK